MYVQSLLGWVEVIHGRVEPLTEVSHLGSASDVWRRTVATEFELLEFRELVASIPAPHHDVGDASSDADAVLSTVLQRPTRPTTLTELDASVRDRVQASDRFIVADGVVVVPLRDHGPAARNVIPAVDRLYDRLLSLAETVRRVTDFAIADRGTIATHLRRSWLVMLGFCYDLCRYCRRLLRRFHRHHRNRSRIESAVAVVRDMTRSSGDPSGENR